MTFQIIPTAVVALCTLAIIVSGQNYEYEAAPAPPRPAPPRVNPSYSGPSSSAPRPTPVPILKQINRHNEDGSYTYGYEGADGSFKIETKLPTGEVKGKYGYVDDTGKVRVVEYGATKYGFEPAGEGITVAPPTLVDETTDKNGILKPEYSGAYYDNEEPQQRQYQPAIRPSVPITKAIARRPAPAIDQSQFEYAGPQQFEPAAPLPQHRPNPVPARAVIPGSVPVSSQSNFEFDFPSPAAARPAQPKSYAPPSRRPAEDLYEAEPQPRITYAQPAAPAPARYTAPAPVPQYRPAPRPAQPPAPIRSGGGGILDQLSKDYALPQGGAAPLHDISFGYY